MPPRKQPSNPPTTPRKRESAITDLDPGASIEDDALEATSTRATQWVSQLNALITKVETSDSGFVAGKFYRIGSFTTAQGARGVVRGFEQHPERKPSRPCEIRSRIVDLPTGGKGSELYAKVIPQAQDDGATTASDD